MIHVNKKGKHIAYLCFCSFSLLCVLSSFVNMGAIAVLFSVIFPVLFLVSLIYTCIGFFLKKYYYCICSIIFLFCFNSPLSYSIAKSLQEDNQISILSYNVRDFNKYKDINKENISEKILNFINAESNDIVCLQESALTEVKSIKNYPYNFIGNIREKKKTLLSIHSKYPIINSGYIDFPNTVNNAIYADVKIKEDTIRVYNLHMQSFSINVNSGNDSRFLNFYNKINKGLTKQIEQARLVKEDAKSCLNKVIICGDLNSTPYANPYRILKSKLQDSFICKGNWLGTTYNLFHYPLRIDYFLVDAKIKIRNHENFNLKLSDHDPVKMIFEL